MSCQKCNGSGMVDCGGVQPWGEPIMIECDCLYRQRDAWELDKEGGYYSRHVMAMTSEGLHSKGDIAAELGYRDMRIDQLEFKLNEMRNAEHALSDSYIRLRHIVGAMNPPSVESKEIWAHTEQKAQELRNRCEALETEWRAQEERAENAETELVDLRERYKQLEAVAKDFLRRNANGPLFYRDLYNRFKEIVK